jgi:hypothetical protein
MSPLQRTFVAVLAVVSLVVVAWRVAVWRAAATELAGARAFHTEVTGKAARVARLRAQPPVSGFGARPGDDVMQLAGRVFGSAGLPTGRLRSVQADPDRALADDRDGRRAATVRLAVEPVTIQELGALLAAWRASQQVWSIARIDLSAMTRATGAGHAAGQYRASIVVTATYIDETTSPPPQPSPSPTSSPSPLLGAAQ